MDGTAALGFQVLAHHHGAPGVLGHVVAAGGGDHGDPRTRTSCDRFHSEQRDDFIGQDRRRFHLCRPKGKPEMCSRTTDEHTSLRGAAKQPSDWFLALMGSQDHDIHPIVIGVAHNRPLGRIGGLTGNLLDGDGLWGAWVRPPPAS